MAWYPGCVKKEVKRHRTAMARYDIIVLHIAVSEADSLYGFFNTPGNPTSHFYVRYDGTVEQYVDTKFRAPAQLDGNDRCIGIETEGLGTGTWTAPQVATLAKLCHWLYETHGIPLQDAETSRQSARGIAPHRYGINPYRVADGELWSSSNGKTCPTNQRIAQIPEIIQRAKAMEKVLVWRVYDADGTQLMWTTGKEKAFARLREVVEGPEAKATISRHWESQP